MSEKGQGQGPPGAPVGAGTVLLAGEGPSEKGQPTPTAVPRAATTVPSRVTEGGSGTQIAQPPGTDAGSVGTGQGSSVAKPSSSLEIANRGSLSRSSDGSTTWTDSRGGTSRYDSETGRWKPIDKGAMLPPPGIVPDTLDWTAQQWNDFADEMAGRRGDRPLEWPTGERGLIDSAADAVVSALHEAGEYVNPPSSDPVAHHSGGLERFARDQAARLSGEGADG